MKRVGRGRTTYTRDGKIKDIVAFTAGKNPTRLWMVYRFRSIAMSAQKDSRSTPTHSSFHVYWRNGSLLLELLSKPSKKPNQIFSVTESRNGEEGVSRAMTSYERRAYNNKITTTFWFHRSASGIRLSYSTGF